MKKSTLSLALLALLCTTLPTNDVCAGNGTKVVLGIGGVAAGTALGVYLHSLAKKQSDRLELLELFKKYTSQESFKGLDDAQAKVAELAAELERLELWDTAAQENLDGISSFAVLDEKIALLTKKWWLITILEALCFSGAAVGGGFAIKGVYNWATTKKPEPQPQPNPQPLPQPQPEPEPKPEPQDEIVMNQITLEQLQKMKEDAKKNIKRLKEIKTKAVIKKVKKKHLPKNYKSPQKRYEKEQEKLRQTIKKLKQKKRAKKKKIKHLPKNYKSPFENATEKIRELKKKREKEKTAAAKKKKKNIKKKKKK